MFVDSPDILIPEAAYKGVTISFCVFAIVGAAGRTAVRFQKGQQHIIDEGLVLFACICLIAATVLLDLGASPLYQLQKAEAAEKANPELAQLLPVESSIKAVSTIQNYTYPFGVLIWAAVFAVKFCYLHFFRLLIDRQKPLVRFWVVTMTVTGIAAVFNTCSSFISCPKFGNQDLKCEEPYSVTRTLAVEAVTISLDIITDLMILAIPPYLLWKVKISSRQKLGIGSFLCLSVFMIVIAIIRISRVHASDFEIWASFWQQFEACIAVLMVSLTAFRTLFVSKNTALNQPQPKRSSSHRKRLWLSPTKPQEEYHVDITVPSATLTGMRTVIGGNQSVSWPLQQDKGNSRDQSIHVIHDVDVPADDGKRPSTEHFV